MTFHTSPKKYVDILCDFYANIKIKIDFNQNVPDFLTPYTYFMLMVCAFVSDEIDLAPYLRHFKITDPLNQVFKPLLEKDVVDIYKYPIRSNLEIKSYNKSLLFLSSEKMLYKYVSSKLNYELTVADFKIIGSLHHSFPCLYDSTSTSIVYNNKWEVVLDIIWNLIEDSENLLVDIHDIFFAIFEDKYEMINAELLFHRVENETILFPMIRNRHLKINIPYIKNVFKSFLKDRWTNIQNSDYLQHILYKEYAFDIDDTRKDILTEILNLHFAKSNKDSHQLVIASANNVLDDGTMTSFDTLSISNTSQYLFKQIISNLLQYITRLLNFDVNDDYIQYRKNTYYTYLYQYYDILKNIGIDLNKYHLNDIILQTPPSIFRSRSMDKSGVASVTSSVRVFAKFQDKQLITRLNKIYERTVQGNTLEDTGRIIKIQKYITRKYKPQPIVHTIQDVIKGHELEYLFTYWMNVLKKGNLHVRYSISYAKEPGVDYGAISNYFFTMVSKQIKGSYFTQIEDSSRYILKNTISADEANFVGQLLAIFIIYNIHIPFNISILYLGHMMFTSEQITHDELFLYYILDLYKSSAAHYYKQCEAPAPSCNIQEIVDDVVPIRYNNDRRQFNRFLAGFFIQKKVFNIKFRSINDKIRIYDLDKILSNCKLTQALLKTLCKNIILQYNNGQQTTVIDKTNENAKVYLFLEELLLIDDYDDLYSHYLDNDKVERIKSKNDFCKNILMFWTGSESIQIDQPYYVYIMSDITMIKASTCANMLKLPLPIYIPTKQDLYNIFMRLFLLDDQHVFSEV
jgi:hypothetical protein